MSAKPRVVALIVAAGSGSRAGSDIPKQYRSVGGKSLVTHAYDSLADHPDIDSVRFVIGAGQEQLFAEAMDGRETDIPTIGGAERQKSVRNGLEAIASDGGTDIVFIHDAARPFVPGKVIGRLLAACADHSGAIPVLPVTDSLVHRQTGTVRRDDYAAVQTPQAFDFEKILAAHRVWPEDRIATDDAEILRAAGHEVALVEGDPALKKLTFAEDFGGNASPSPVRTGFGYDVHAFGPGDSVWLGGVEIAHDRSLAGHSDADVALHSLTDAILGALGAGDIGSHFPPSDPQWKGAPSHLFLDHAASLARDAGYEIGNVDVTIVCEAPKVGPHRNAMRGRIAEILAISENAVSIKATTTEKLGFAGRREGIAAQAVATLILGRN